MRFVRVQRFHANCVPRQVWDVSTNGYVVFCATSKGKLRADRFGGDCCRTRARSQCFRRPLRRPVRRLSTGTGGAAGSVERLATQAAIDELKAGGNAIDAAVVAAGVLGVTEPFSCGIGGGGFMVIRTADGKVTTIDGRETAPAAMTPTSFWANGAASAAAATPFAR